MPALVYDTTLTAPFTPTGADVLWLGASGGSVWVLAGDSTTLRLIELSQNSLALLGTTQIAGATAPSVVANTGSYGITFSASLFDLAGSIGKQVLAFDDDTAITADQIKLVRATLSGTDTIAVSHPDRSGFSLFGVTGNALSLIDQALATPGGAISDITFASGYGTNWMVALDAQNDALETWSVSPAGLAHRATFGAVDGLGINTPTAVSSVTLAGQPYVVLASANSNSVSLVRIEADGSMTPTDHVLDDLNTRFATPSKIAVVQTSDATFAALAGNDDGVTLLRILEDGSFLHLATLAQQSGWALDNPSAIEAWTNGNILKILVASSTQIGLSQFTMDISALTPEIWGTSGADLLTGGANDDVILAGDGNDTISAAGGDDTLRDGDGADVMTGGAGADCFQLVLDSHIDRITDFDPAQDSFDFSHYPLAHDLGALSVTPTAWGARLAIRGDILDVFSASGNALSAADLTKRNPFPLDRPPLILSPGGSGANGPQIQVGSNGNDILFGALTDDILTGNNGDDTLIGGSGADQLLGGAGFDRVSYQTAVAPITLDLASPSLNTGDALGDTFASIEVFEGSGFADSLFGNNSKNHLDGGVGDDLIHGRGGNDTLSGDAGNDTLDGGTGSDNLDGGPDNDTATYASATKGIIADLLHATRNTGHAAGDKFSSIENLIGSPHSDQMAGDDGSNRLTGGSGNDRLIGRAGDDVLTGGSGNDVLRAGLGKDSLNGGSGRDLADYVDMKTAVQANLSTGLGAGGATGDTYLAIEDLAGSLFDDSLTGSNSSNMLFGLDGDDTLCGKGGADTLSGGDGTDVFRFSRNDGADHISDFDPDQDHVLIDLGLTGGSKNADQLIANFAAMISGQVVIDFGQGDSILFEGITDAFALSDSFLFF